MNDLKVLNVEGMTCNGCANRVAKALKQVPGVTDARVTLSEKKVEVETQGNVDVAQLLDAVNGKGYGATLAS